MKNIAKIISLNEEIEEEAVVQINNTKFVAFMVYVPYAVEINKHYPVDVGFFADEIDIQENSEVVKNLIRVGETFQYAVNGYLNDKGQLNVGFLIEDEIFEDYEYLYGKYVKFKVDRIDLGFDIEE